MVSQIVKYGSLGNKMAIVQSCLFYIPSCCRCWVTNLPSVKWRCSSKGHTASPGSVCRDAQASFSPTGHQSWEERSCCFHPWDKPQQHWLLGVGMQSWVSPTRPLTAGTGPRSNCGELGNFFPPDAGGLGALGLHCITDQQSKYPILVALGKMQQGPGDRTFYYNGNSFWILPGVAECWHSKACL